VEKLMTDKMRVAVRTSNTNPFWSQFLSYHANLFSDLFSDLFNKTGLRQT
jgi:hypothetical protein